ncbi:hypothetical protein BGZ60DRAFT_117908 [Tricladium varicosporioides]|nr:hypothetical protein BGZ60DRAFT_117908 [Hymenoscyphus varicosporioides]
MDELPVELRRGILQNLELRDIKAIRRTSKLWSKLGEEYLLSPHFHSLPHRPDLDRLEAISKSPKFCNRIQSLTFNHGEVNEYHARHNTYFLNYMQQTDARVEAQYQFWEQYTILKSLKETYLPAYFDTDRLARILRCLNNVQDIEVTVMTCPFMDEDDPGLLRDIWNIPSTRLLPRLSTTERFTNLLVAVSSNLSVITLKSLRHDRLPFEFFSQKPMLIDQLSSVFSMLTSLNLAIDYSDMPNNLYYAKGFHNLFQFLRTPTALRALSLSFLGRKKLDISPLFSSFQEHGYSFPCLGRLTLQGISACERELGNFIVGQETLNYLQVGGAGLKNRHQPANGGILLMKGTFRTLFERIKSSLSLETFLVQGDLVGSESGERWILEESVPEEDLKEYVTD